MSFRRIVFACSALATLIATPAHATFHLMQIEQVMGGVDGNTNAQAIQLRERALNQTQLQNARLIAWDAAGANPVLIIAFTVPVGNGAVGARILVATPDFSLMTNPPATPDFMMTNRIPDSYLAAGSLTFEDNFGDVLWRLSWGGASYTGSGTGLTTNDLDGIFNPPFAGPLPSGNDQALLFTGLATDKSTNNAAQYALTTGSAVFTNNLNQTGTSVGVDLGRAPGAVALSVPAPNPVRGAMLYHVDLPRAAHVQVRVVDITGRVVERLVDRALSAGHHEFSWNAGTAGGSRVASGLYLLELRTSGWTTSRRFVVVR